MYVVSTTTGDKLEIDFGAVRMVGGIIPADRSVGGDVNIKYKHVLIQKLSYKLRFTSSLLSFVLILCFFMFTGSAVSQVITAYSIHYLDDLNSWRAILNPDGFEKVCII